MNSQNSIYIQKIKEQSKIKIEDLLVLICSIIIASVGLNLNSTPIVIGAMLISPLMTPVIGIGVSLAFQKKQLLKYMLFLLLIEILISLMVSIIYFMITPLSFPTDEILARTSPTIWDVIIAFTGGVAGAVGFYKKEVTNIIPGVAISTALMPPLCTMSYSIVNQNIEYILGSSYLFVINVYFIIIATLLTSYFLEVRKIGLKSSIQTKRKNYMMIVTTFIIIIPSFYSASQLVQESITQNKLTQFITNEFEEAIILDKKVITNKNIIQLTVLGEDIDNSQIQNLQKKLDKYDLGNLDLNIKQVSNIPENNVSNQDLEAVIDGIISKRLRSTENKEDEMNKLIVKNNKLIKDHYPNDIDKIYMNSILNGEEENNVLTIELKSNLTDKLKKDIESYVYTLYKDDNVKNLLILFN